MEKYQRYRFEQAVQEVNESSILWLKDEYKTILESNKPYQSKCDYIGYSINSIDEKIILLDQEIKELQSYKQKLKTAKELALITGAEVFESYGISKIEGGGISSITVTKSSSTTKTVIKATNEEELINAGFYRKVIDEKAIQRAYEEDNYKDLIHKYCEVSTITDTKPSKIKVNKRRAVNNTELTLEKVA